MTWRTIRYGIDVRIHILKFCLHHLSPVDKWFGQRRRRTSWRSDEKGRRKHQSIPVHRFKVSCFTLVFTTWKPLESVSYVEKLKGGWSNYASTCYWNLMYLTSSCLVNLRQAPFPIGNLFVVERWVRNILALYWKRQTGRNTSNKHHNVITFNIFNLMGGFN